MNRPPVLQKPPPPANARPGHYGVAIILLCGLSSAAELPFAVWQTEWTQLLGMLGFGGYLLALIAGFRFAGTQWRQLRWLAVIPLLLCLGSCAVSREVGRAARQAQFERRLPRYQALVQGIEQGNSLVAGKVTRIPLSEGDRDLGYNLLAERDTNGALTIELLTGGGFPVKHSGYLYTSSGKIQSGSFFDSRWPFKTEVKPKWFRISD